MFRLCRIFDDTLEIDQKETAQVQKFGPAFLAVGLGLDTAKSDPTRDGMLRVRDFPANGRIVGV
jgi:hypothetical protein